MAVKSESITPKLLRMNEQVTMQIFDGMLTRPKGHWIGPFDWWGLSRPDIVMKRIVQTSGVEQKVHLVKI